LSIFYHVT